MLCSVHNEAWWHIRECGIDNFACRRSENRQHHGASAHISVGIRSGTVTSTGVGM